MRQEQSDLCAFTNYLVLESLQSVVSVTMPGSSSWISLTTALPLDLQHAAADVAKAVWSEVGGIEVGQLDHWWHVARLSYIGRADGSPEALILNCVEGEPTTPRSRPHTQWTSCGGESRSSKVNKAMRRYLRIVSLDSIVFKNG